MASLQEAWLLENGNLEGSSKEIRHGRTAQNMSSSSLRKKRMQREESATAPHRKRKSSNVAERASTSIHKIKPEKEMMKKEKKKKKKKLRAKPLENIEAFGAAMKMQLQTSKSLLMEQEAIVEAFQGEVTQMRELNEQLSRMNLRDQLVADYIYSNLL